MSTVTVDPALIQNVVREVLSKLGTPSPGGMNGSALAGARPGLVGDVDTAVRQAKAAQAKLAAAPLETRQKLGDRIKALALQHAKAWGEFELHETQVGRLDHKIAKLELLQGIPGVEYLRRSTVAHSGDHGIALDELAPFGVIGVITPVTHSIPTLLANAINMTAGGNVLVVNAHPSGHQSASLAAEAVNRMAMNELGLDPVIFCIDPPTLESASAIFEHPEIPLLCVTGGPAVAKAAMAQPKRAVVAGPGNPPVVVDETADLDNAAKSIIAGAAFDNNLLCIGEKEVFVVASVFDRFMAAMRSAGAAELSAPQIAELTQKAFKTSESRTIVNKDYVGKDAAVLAQAAGTTVPGSVELLFGETDESHPFVSHEQMMPFVPIVKVPDFEAGLALALKHEHGYGHTAIIHSHNLDRITAMGRAVNTTLFAANGPCTACLGSGGEGYPSYSIATPTGEGITTPHTFMRFRRNTVAGALRIV